MRKKSPRRLAEFEPPRVEKGKTFRLDRLESGIIKYIANCVLHCFDMSSFQRHIGKINNLMIKNERTKEVHTISPHRLM